MTIEAQLPMMAYAVGSENAGAIKIWNIMGPFLINAVEIVYNAKEKKSIITISAALNGETKKFCLNYMGYTKIFTTEKEALEYFKEKSGEVAKSLVK